MKAITTKEFVSLVIIAITAPLFALALVGGVRAMYASGNEFLPVGTNSMWRSREWDQRLRPPHGRSRTPVAQEPQGATV